MVYSIHKGMRRKHQDESNFKHSLIEALGIKNREMISLVGAGGKTTLMFLLAKELVLNGKKVVTTTTTKIFEPTSEETNFISIGMEEKKIREEVRNNIHQYSHLTIAQDRLESRKLKGVSPGLVDDLWSLNAIDVILVEADGAKGKSIKAPEEWEPVIPSKTTLVIAILGLDGLGMELNGNNVFRAEQVSQLTGTPMGERITDEVMTTLMTHPKGIFKGAPFTSRVISFLNKVDIPNGLPKGKQLAEKILEKRHPQIERIVLGQLKEYPPIVEVIFQ